MTPTSFHIARSGQQSGPHSLAVVRQMIARGELTPTDKCWQTTWDSWREVGEVFSPAGELRPPFDLPTRPPPRTSGKAIASILLGAAGFLVLVTSIPAIIFGHIARSEIRRPGSSLSGGGLALAGLIMGYSLVALFLIGFIAALAIPAFQRVRTTAQETAIRNNLIRFSTAADERLRDPAVDQVTFTDLVGPGRALESLTPVAGEDYTSLVVDDTTESLEVVTRRGRYVEYVTPDGQIRRNLRLLIAAADQFMLETRSDHATYDVLVGPRNYVKQMPPVQGEDYTSLVIRADTRKLSVTTADGRELSVYRQGAQFTL